MNEETTEEERYRAEIAALKAEVVRHTAQSRADQPASDAPERGR